MVMRSPNPQVLDIVNANTQRPLAMRVRRCIEPATGELPHTSTASGKSYSSTTELFLSTPAERVSGRADWNAVSTDSRPRSLTLGAMGFTAPQLQRGNHAGNLEKYSSDRLLASRSTKRCVLQNGVLNVYTGSDGAQGTRRLEEVFCI